MAERPDPVPAAGATAAELRQAALRLAYAFDAANLHIAAAHASMAADASRAAPVSLPAEEDLRTDVESEFCLDEHSRVWLIVEGDCFIIGRRGAVCAEMRRFLASLVPGEGAP